jgi:Antibiotic biosynthesis monooxygenase
LGYRSGRGLYRPGDEALGEVAEALAIIVELQSTRRTPTFMLVTRWADRAALKRYMRSPDFRAVHQGNEEDGADFAIYEVVTATSQGRTASREWRRKWRGIRVGRCCVTSASFAYLDHLLGQFRWTGAERAFAPTKTAKMRRNV